MANYNIIFFNVESKTEDNGTYEVMNTCKTDGNKFYPVSTDSRGLNFIIILIMFLLVGIMKKNLESLDLKPNTEIYAKPTLLLY